MCDRREQRHGPSIAKAEKSAGNIIRIRGSVRLRGMVSAVTGHYRPTKLHDQGYRCVTLQLCDSSPGANMLNTANLFLLGELITVPVPANEWLELTAVVRRFRRVVMLNITATGHSPGTRIFISMQTTDFVFISGYRKEMIFPVRYSHRLGTENGAGTC